MKRRLRPALSLILIPIMALSFSACGEDQQKQTQEVTTAEVIPEKKYIGDTNRNTIRLSPDGGVLEIAVEDFTGVTYELEDLKSFIQTEVDGYNQKIGVNKISFREIIQEGNVIKTAISYSDLDAYNTFNRMSVKLSSYDPATANQIAAEEAKKREAEESSTKATISDDELAEAGYDPAEMGEQDIAELVEEKSVTATFSGLTGDTVASDTIDSNENMMLVTDEKLAVELEKGKLLYVNPHASFSEGAAVTDGEGTAVIVLFLGL